jgi:TPR repeat protein
VSTFKISDGKTAEESLIQVPIWIRDDDHLASLNGEELPDGAALNAIGWSLSFSWRTAKADWFEAPGIDLVAAKSFFLASAEKGFWAAWNNLGVMARDGLGTAPDPEQAFRCFQHAAESLDPVPLRHLAVCHRQGIGTPINQDQAADLEKLAATREAGGSD